MRGQEQMHRLGIRRGLRLQEIKGQDKRPVQDKLRDVSLVLKWNVSSCHCLEGHKDGRLSILEAYV